MRDSTLNKTIQITNSIHNIIKEINENHSDNFEHVSRTRESVDWIDGAFWTHYMCRNVYYNGQKVINLNISDDRNDQFGIVVSDDNNVNDDDIDGTNVFELNIDDVITLVIK